jgi:putative nucleotidyltransferase with HDIG domain
MERPLRVLIIEDSEDDTQLLLRELRRAGYEVEFERVETAEAMQSALTQKAWDLILSDYTMPQFNAPKALAVLKASGLDLPFIISSGTIGEETAVTALKAGAHDFFVKGKFARLGPAIERELREAQTRRQRRRAEEALREKERLLFEAQRIGHIGSWSYEIVIDRLMYSDEMYRLLDISPQEFQHNEEGLLSLIYSADRAGVANWMEDIKAGKQVRELDFRVFHRNSELRYIRCSGAVDFDSQGKPAHFIGTAQDVTERKLAEIQIRQQIERLNALRKIDQAIISSFDLRSTMDTVLSQVISQLQVDAVDILLLDPEGNTLEYAAGRGFRRMTVETAQVRVGDGHAGRAAQEHRLIKIENLKNQPDDPHRSKLLAEEDFVSYIGVPLIVKGKEKGVLEVFHRAPLYPYPEWLDFLNTLVGQAAIAIENATLFKNLQQSNLELSQAYDATIEGWSRALDLRDKETEGHTQRVTEMTLALVRKFGFTDEELQYIRWGALLHDIGKMGVPDSILLKPNKLTEHEWLSMKKHPVFAFEMLSPISFLAPALDIPYCHHEKWDGTGYPRGLKGEEISLGARLFAVVDVWDALRSDRPYRSAWTREKTLEHIKSVSGTHFDPKAVEYFLELIKE